MRRTEAKARAAWADNPGSHERGGRRAAEVRAVRGCPRHGEGHPTTSDTEYSAEELEFMGAIRAFQERTGRKFPTWSEALRVAKSLGYQKVVA